MKVFTSSLILPRKLTRLANQFLAFFKNYILFHGVGSATNYRVVSSGLDHLG